MNKCRAAKSAEKGCGSGKGGVAKIAARFAPFFLSLSPFRARPGNSLWLRHCSGVYCLFYYSDHGFRHQNVDYIMPIDVSSGLKCDDCIPVNQISHHLQQTKCKVIMLLDCCREKLVIFYDCFSCVD